MLSSLGIPTDAYTFVAISLLVGVAYVASEIASYVFRYRKALSVGSEFPGPQAKFPGGCVWAMDSPHLDGYVDKYGDKEEGVARCQVLAKATFVLEHHEHLKKVFGYATHHASQAGEMFGQNKEVNVPRWMLGEGSLVYTDYDKHNLWLKLRRLMSRAFLQINVQKQVPRMRVVHQRFADYLRSQIADTGGDSASIDFEFVLRAYTFDMLGEAAFSQNFGAIASLRGSPPPPALAAFVLLSDEIGLRSTQTLIAQPWLQPRFVWIPTPRNIKMNAARTTLRSEVSRLITERRKVLAEKPDTQFGDFLHRMIEASDEEEGFSLSPTQLRDNVLTIMFAGHDTTQITLTFVLYAIARHTEVQRKVQEEVDACLLGDGTVAEDTYASLEYTKCVVREALRMFPPLLIDARSVQKDIKLTEKYTIPKNGLIFFPLFSIMRSEHNWERANEFLPERHLAKDNAPYHAFAAFMHGQRNCIGMRFAEQSVALSVAYLCRNFEFRLPEDYVMEFDVDASPFLRAKHGLPLVVKERVQRS